MQQYLSIALITGQLGLGGAEKQLYLLVRGLLQAGWRVSVITLNPGKGDYWEGPLRELGVSVHEVPTGLARLQRLLAIRHILCQERTQIVHSWSLHTNFYAAAGGRLSGVPVRMGAERANHHLSRQALGRWLYDLSLWGLDSLVANSGPAANFLRQYRPGLAVRVVPNGVEVPKLLANAEERERLRASLGIPASPPVIVAVGSMVPRKNFATLIQAAGVITQKRPETILVLIGGGPLRHDLERQALASLPKGHFVFTGALANAANWFPAFDLLCMPSLDQEGMPNVLMEASATGLPVVASEVGGVPKVVEDNITGFLVPPNDVHSLVDRLEKLLADSNLRRRMGQAGREKMRREFSVERMVARMIAVYEDTLRAKGMV